MNYIDRFFITFLITALINPEDTPPIRIFIITAVISLIISYAWHLLSKKLDSVIKENKESKSGL